MASKYFFSGNQANINESSWKELSAETLAFLTVMSVCMMNYDIRILSALKTGAPAFVRILSAFKCGQNADRNYRHKSKKCQKYETRPCHWVNTGFPYIESTVDKDYTRWYQCYQWTKMYKLSSLSHFRTTSRLYLFLSQWNNGCYCWSEVWNHLRWKYSNEMEPQLSPNGVQRKIHQSIWCSDVFLPYRVSDRNSPCSMAAVIVCFFHYRCCRFLSQYEGGKWDTIYLHWPSGYNI